METLIVTQATNQALPRSCNPSVTKSLTHRNPGCDWTMSHENPGVTQSYPRYYKRYMHTDKSVLYIYEKASHSWHWSKWWMGMINFFKNGSFITYFTSTMMTVPLQDAHNTTVYHHYHRHDIQVMWAIYKSDITFSKYRDLNEVKILLTGNKHTYTQHIYMWSDVFDVKR
jgi:hypothetical protein